MRTATADPRRRDRDLPPLLIYPTSSRDTALRARPSFPSVSAAIDRDTAAHLLEQTRTRPRLRAHTENGRPAQPSAMLSPVSQLPVSCAA